MQRFKFLLIMGIFLAILGSFGLYFTEETDKLSHLSSTLLGMGMTMTLMSFVVKKRIESGAMIKDERTDKIGAKAVGWSWYITLIIVSLGMIMDSFLYKFSGTIVLNLIFVIMLLTYVVMFYYYKNKKV